MAAPHRSRYPRPLRATHTFTSSPAASAGAPRPQQAKRYYPVVAAGSPSSPGAPAGKKANLPRSPDSPRAATSERLGALVPLEIQDSELDSRRRANSLTSLADPSCCYGNSLWQQGTRTNQDGGEEEETANEEPISHGFSHKRSNSCSSADSLGKRVPVTAATRRGDAVHTTKSIEGLNQEISSVLEGVQIISPHHPPDGHMAPTTELLSLVPHSSPQFTIQLSPSSLPSSLPFSPHPHSTPSPSALGTPTELPDTPTGFSLPPSPSLSNPSFARDPPDGIERCLTTELKPFSTELTPIGPDKSKANIVFQKSSAFLPTHRVVAINSVS